MRLLVGLGWICIVIAFLLGGRSSRLEDALVPFQLRKPEFSRWGPPEDDYRREGWPLHRRMRQALAGVYVFGLLGVLILLYACPRA